jgi:chromate transporter
MVNSQPTLPRRARTAVLLALSLRHGWQILVLALAAIWLLGLRKGVVSALLGAGAPGVLAALLSFPVG